MNVNINNLISLSEADSNFSKVVRMVDEQGTAVIIKDDSPRYVLIDYNLLMPDVIADDDEVFAAAAEILQTHIKAFKELAK
jgi:antitoxin Phd